MLSVENKNQSILTSNGGGLTYTQATLLILTGKLWRSVQIYYTYMLYMWYLSRKCTNISSLIGCDSQNPLMEQAAEEGSNQQLSEERHYQYEELHSRPFVTPNSEIPENLLHLWYPWKMSYEQFTPQFFSLSSITLGNRKQMHVSICHKDSLHSSVFSCVSGDFKNAKNVVDNGRQGTAICLKTNQTIIVIISGPLAA